MILAQDFVSLGDRSASPNHILKVLTKRIVNSVKLLVFIVSFIAGCTVPTGAQLSGYCNDEEAIKQVIAGTTEAFNKHDAKAFTRFTVRGERMKGAAEIEKGLAAIFSTRAKASTLKTLNVTIRFIRRRWR